MISVADSKALLLLKSWLVGAVKDTATADLAALILKVDRFCDFGLADCEQ
jgi:hypothetical protein